MSALLEAAKAILTRHTSTGADHARGCKCRACTEGPWIVHDRCNLSHVGNREGIVHGGVEITCTCGLSALAKAAREEEELYPPPDMDDEMEEP